MTIGNPDRPQYHLLPKDDPGRAVEMLRAAAGLDPLQPGPDQPETDGAEPGRARGEAELQSSTSVTISRMGDTLKVTVAGLRALSQTCTDQAEQLVTSPSPPVAAAAWQASSAGVSTVNARGSKVTATMGARLRANAAKFSQAADDYQTQDEHSAVAVSAAAPPAASPGADGGAGGAAPTPPVPVTAGVGADGGAGAFPVLR